MTALRPGVRPRPRRPGFRRAAAVGDPRSRTGVHSWCTMTDLVTAYAERGFRVATICHPLCKDYVNGTNPLLP